MKLAEALQARTDLNTRLEQLRSRLQKNAVMQEGIAPAEDPEELLREAEACLAELGSLMTRINLTNCATTVEGRSLTALLAERDVLRMRLSLLRDTAEAASDLTERYSQAEIRKLSALDVKKLRRQVDECAAAFRRLDNTIQAMNWQTELLN